MAYCKECGAYVAEGLTKCPACGKSLREPKKKKVDRDDSWDIYEDNGRPRGSARQSERRGYDRGFGSAYDSSSGRSGSYDARGGYSGSYERGGRDYRGDYGRRSDGWSISTEQRIFAVLSYVSWLFVIPLLLRRNDPFVRSHLNQGIVLFIISCLCFFIGILGWLVNIAVFFFCLAGGINALMGRIVCLPIVSSIEILK